MRAGDDESPGYREGRTRPSLRLLRGITGLLDWTGRIVTATCLAAMFAAMLVNVVLRYAFGSGIAWAYEIHALLLPWLVAGGLVVATARSSNIAVTILPDLLPGGGRRAVEVAVQVVILVISLSVLWSSQPILKASQFQTLSTLGFTQVWGYSSLVFAFGAMAILAAATILRVLKGEDPTHRDPARASLS